MIYIVYNDDYIAAVTNDPKELSEWIHYSDIPEGMRINTFNYEFPFFALENNNLPNGLSFKYSFFPGDYEKSNTAALINLKRWTQKYTIYTFDKPWQGNRSWSDNMGSLNHQHFNGEE